jgi:hypothetical protein
VIQHSNPAHIFDICDIAAHFDIGPLSFAQLPNLKWNALWLQFVFVLPIRYHISTINIEIYIA